MIPQMFFLLTRALLWLLVLCLVSGCAALKEMGIVKVTENDKIEVIKISFEGNKAFSGRTLKQRIGTEASSLFPFGKKKYFDKEFFNKDIKRVEKFYRDRGYLEARVLKYEIKGKNRIKIKIFVSEGKPFILEKFGILFEHEEDSRLNRKALLDEIQLRVNRPLDADKLILAKKWLEEKAENVGYAHAEAVVDTQINHVRKKASVTFYLKEGPVCRFRNIAIEGINHVRGQVVSRELEFKRGDIYSTFKLEESQRNLYRFDLFNFVMIKLTNLQEKGDSLDVVVIVREGQPQFVKFGVGYGTEEQFWATGVWRHKNFFGGARRLETEVKYSSIIREISTRFNTPYFLDRKSDLGIEVSYKLEREVAFRVYSLTGRIRLARQFARYTNGFVEYAQSAVDSLGKQSNLSTSIFGLRRDNTNDIFSPTSGLSTSIQLEQTGILFSSDFAYYGVEFENRWYRKIPLNTVFATRVDAGYMQPSRGNKTIPTFKRFFSGGSTSVRGWQRGNLGPLDARGIPTGGNILLEGNAELRFGIYKEFGGVIFLDYGNVWKDRTDFDIKSVKFSIGAGLRYQTLIGPVRVDIAYKLKRDPLEGRILPHFSIGQAF